MNAMNKRMFYLLFIVSMLLSACGAGEEPPPPPTGTITSFKFFQDGYYQVIVPDWQDSEVLDADSIFTVQQDGQFIMVNRYQNLPEIFAEQFLKYIEDDQNAYLVQEKHLGGKPFFEFTTRENNQTMRLQAVLDYCQGQTYALITGGRDTVENTDLFQQVLTSSYCADPVLVPELDTGKIGLMVNPAQDDFWQGYYPALRLAKASGVQVLHSYMLWSQVEDSPDARSWEWNDALMGYRFHEGFEVSLVVNLIHTGVRGPMPGDLQNMDFDDPEFIQRFTDFILDVLERYPVQYLSIGNEVNDYFVKHREEIPAYKTFFLTVYDAIKVQYPDVMVAMTFAYHDAESQDALDIIQQLDLGDFLPVTLYLYDQGFQFSRDPVELELYINRILDLAGDKPIAFAEIGWSTAESLGGTQVDQAQFLSEAFRLLADHREQIEFLSWFSLHDSKLENSHDAAFTFLTDRPDLARDEDFMVMFVDFLNYMGLRENDGTPKEAWLVFQQEASLYLQNLP
jgi:hypothetical protein